MDSFLYGYFLELVDPFFPGTVYVCPGPFKLKVMYAMGLY